jgi:hypothetical protein
VIFYVMLAFETKISLGLSLQFLQLFFELSNTLAMQERTKQLRKPGSKIMGRGRDPGVVGNFDEQ